MNELGGYEFNELRVGMSAVFAKTITEADIVLFAGVSGDNNAIHTNEEFAAITIFKGRIAHGMLSASVISAFANKLPGPGTIYMSQNYGLGRPSGPAIPCVRPSRSKRLFQRNIASCSARTARLADRW